MYLSYKRIIFLSIFLFVSLGSKSAHADIEIVNLQFGQYAALTRILPPPPPNSEVIICPAGWTVVNEFSGRPATPQPVGCQKNVIVSSLAIADENECPTMQTVQELAALTGQLESTIEIEYVGSGLFAEKVEFISGQYETCKVITDPVKPPPPPPVKPKQAPAPDPVISDNPLIVPGSPESQTARALDAYCRHFSIINNPTAQQKDLYERCRNLQDESGDVLQYEGVRELGVRSYASQISNSLNSSRAFILNITDRLAAIREAAKASGEALSHQPTKDLGTLIADVLTGKKIQYRGGSAGDDNQDNANRIGFFVSGLNGIIEKEDTERSAGFDNDSYNITLGADYLLPNAGYIGAAYGYGVSNSDFSNNGGYMDATTHSLSIYGGKSFDGDWFIDGALGFGNTDFDARRNVVYIAEGVPVNQAALSSPEGEHWFVSLGLGKAYSYNSWDIEWHTRANYLDMHVDRFSEQMLNPHAAGFGVGLEIDDINAKSKTTDVGVHVSKSISQNFGVVVPYLGLSWIHEFEQGHDELQARFLHDPFSLNFAYSGIGEVGPDGSPPTVFTLEAESFDSDYGNIRLGTNVLLPNKLTLSINVNKSVGLDNFDQTFYSIGLRKTF